MPNRSTMTRAALLVSAIFITACGASQPAPIPQPAEGAEPAATSAAAEDTGPTVWSDDMSKADKGAFMKSHVSPKMAAVFQSASAERHADFGCATCHGDPWNDHPQDALPKLKMKDGKFDVDEKMGPVVEFMMTKVVPEMAGVLGKSPYNPETHEGFGCAGCHVVEM